MKRKINASQFADQLDEVLGLDPGSLLEIGVNSQESIWARIPVNLSPDDPYALRFQELAEEANLDGMVIESLSHKEGMTAEEQLERWFSTGRSAMDLFVIIQTETERAREALGKFRYRTSAR